MDSYLESEEFLFPCHFVDVMLPWCEGFQLGKEAALTSSLIVQPLVRVARQGTIGARSAQKKEQLDVVWVIFNHFSALMWRNYIKLSLLANASLEFWNRI